MRHAFGGFTKDVARGLTLRKSNIMNLLIVESHVPQAYAMIRALRPYARKIVITMDGRNRLIARLSHAANSQLVDQRYYLRSAVDDWRAGSITKQNTQREEAYIQAVLKICEIEKIDTIFTFLDPQVYVFSKNKPQFETMGILIPVPDYESVLTPLDKYRTIRAAQQVGIPCPKTFLSEGEEDLKRIADELNFPVVIKPRFTFGGRGMKIAANLEELLQITRLVKQNQKTPLLQEYIPGREKDLLSLVVDKSGELKSAFYERRVRHLRRVIATVPTVSKCLAPHPYSNQIKTLMQTIGWWGSAGLEMKVDPRDGIPKLMEINPRFGRGLWRRTESGINEPLMCLAIARGEEIEPVMNYPVGAIFVDPVEDIMALGLHMLDLPIYKYRIRVGGKAPVDPLNPPMSLKGLVQSYWETYLIEKKKVYNPHFKYFFQDPLVSILWWLQFYTWVLGTMKQLGR